MIKVKTVCFFFFSSRRRHTRWTGDWSSDVCSSDLHRIRLRRARDRARSWWDHRGRVTATNSRRRSEERRVGKECRSRWLPEQIKKKRSDTSTHQLQFLLEFLLTNQ